MEIELKPINIIFIAFCNNPKCKNTISIDVEEDTPKDDEITITCEECGNSIRISYEVDTI
ncbi:hypothetical protein LCGC14_0495020 [marine sediment metagenome]|uniref:DPH-type MB domain-containing protein n=1 Tax=marine sediment metagenome TaxID=412755 RepID=A0A0F9S5C8_9ZZZZ